MPVPQGQAFVEIGLLRLQSLQVPRVKSSNMSPREISRDAGSIEVYGHKQKR